MAEEDLAEEDLGEEDLGTTGRLKPGDSLSLVPASELREGVRQRIKDLGAINLQIVATTTDSSVITCNWHDGVARIKELENELQSERQRVATLAQKKSANSEKLSNLKRRQAEAQENLESGQQIKKLRFNTRPIVRDVEELHVALQVTTISQLKGLSPQQIADLLDKLEGCWWNTPTLEAHVETHKNKVFFHFYFSRPGTATRLDAWVYCEESGTYERWLTRLALLCGMEIDKKIDQDPNAPTLADLDQPCMAHAFAVRRRYD